MNALLRCLSATTALASVGAALAQSAEQGSPPDGHPPRSVTFGVLRPIEAPPTKGVSEDGATTAGEITTSENRLSGAQFFVPVDGASPLPLNPPSRDAVRASIRTRYPDLAEGIGIDASAAERLLDLLTEHQLSTFGTNSLNTPQASADWVLKEADVEAKRLDALRGLLGEAGLERYVDYSTTVRERLQVSTLDARLPSEHKLLPAQREQMIALYREENARQSELHHGRFFGASNSFFPGEDLQRASQLATIAANELHLRTMLQSQRLLWQRAAKFLSAPQLAALSLLHAEEQNSLRQWIQTARARAGLDPADHPPLAGDELQEPHMPLAVRMKVDIELTINRNEPMAVSYVVMNGETVAFEAGDGLFVEATPRLYEDETVNVQLDYYERRGTRKRRLTDVATVSNISPQTMRLEGERIGTEKFTVTSGTKAFAIQANIEVAAL